MLFDRFLAVVADTKKRQGFANFLCYHETNHVFHDTMQMHRWFEGEAAEVDRLILM